MVLRVTKGDLLQMQDIDYIAHQCNCVTNNRRGLAKSLFDRYPEANIYKHRIKPDRPGHNIIVPTHDGPSIINMLAQYTPGAGSGRETAAQREKWFRDCLNDLKVSLGANTRRVAMPWLIGCGLAGGDWNRYHQMLKDFALDVPFDVILVMLPSSQPAPAVRGRGWGSTSRGRGGKGRGRGRPLAGLPR